MLMKLFAAILPGALLLYQSAAPVAGPNADGLISNLDRLTLAGAAVLACGVLWRALAKKDDLLVEMMKSVTAALTGASDSNKELRLIIEESVRTKQELRVSIDQLRTGLNALPCNIPDEVAARHGK